MTAETILKNQIKEYLAIKRIFNFPLLQGIGSYKGLPDRILFWQGKAIFLEIKKPDGKLSEYQKEFKKNCEDNLIDYWVVHNLEELIDRLSKKYGIN